MCACVHQRNESDREAAVAADQALVAESRRIMDAKDKARKDELQARLDKMQVQTCCFS